MTGDDTDPVCPAVRSGNREVVQAKVTNAEDRGRYELEVDGTLVGIADYRVSGDSVTMPHTEIDPARRGQGLGEVLVREALDDIRTTGRKVIPSCWFVREFIEQNPEYADLLA